MDPGAILRRGSAYNAIVVIRVALRLHQRLLAPGGTTDEVSSRGIALVVGAHDLFCHERHLVGGSVSPVNPALRAIEEDGGGGAGRGSHAHVGVGNRIAAPQTFRHGAVADLAGKAAIAGTLQALVPV